uniref:glutathione S-transferase family protein n=1 Tax=Stappia sp. TaxID=1870903 RepID=UPI003BA95169
MTATPYTVIGHPQSRAMRVIWMLEELGEPYELRPFRPQSDEVRALNPLGKIPVLKEGEAVLTDSVAICTYLADRNGRLTAQAGTLARARQDALTQFVVDEVEGALWTAAKNSFIHPEELRVPEIKKVCRAEFAKAMERATLLLGDRTWLSGDDFTLPDLLLGHCAGWARAAKFDLPADGPLAEYFARVTRRPAFLAAMKRAATALESA